MSIMRCSFWPNYLFFQTSPKNVNFPILHKFDQWWLQLITFSQRPIFANSAAMMPVPHYRDPENARVM